ncbi:MAG TPA: hypothetical protein VN947_29605 [Polyangia bacterium]|nr:hypothetical protein [Polyangia bacterium]
MAGLAIGAAVRRYWYVRADVARVLDDGGVPWRRFLVGEIDAPPHVATRQLELE